MVKIETTQTTKKCTACGNGHLLRKRAPRTYPKAKLPMINGKHAREWHECDTCGTTFRVEKSGNGQRSRIFML